MTPVPVTVTVIDEGEVGDDPPQAETSAAINGATSRNLRITRDPERVGPRRSKWSTTVRYPVDSIEQGARGSCCPTKETGRRLRRTLIDANFFPVTRMPQSVAFLRVRSLNVPPTINGQASAVDGDTANPGRKCFVALFRRSNPAAPMAVDLGCGREIRSELPKAPARRRGGPTLRGAARLVAWQRTSNLEPVS